MVSFFLILIFAIRGCVQAASDPVSTTSFPLTSKSKMVHACSYDQPLASISISHEGMPCNFLYPNSSLQNGFMSRFNASYVEAFSTLRVINGIRCFKLEMVTSCEQKWLAANKIERYYNVLQPSRQDCLGSGVCANCEIAGQYLRENCETFTFGPNEVKKTVVYTTQVVVHQNKIGQAFYGGITSTVQEFDLGGSLREKVYFTFSDFDDRVRGEFTVNPHTLAVISYDMRRILANSNFTQTYMGEQYYIYEQNHLILKKSVDEEVAKLRPNSRLLQSSSGNQQDQSFTAFQNYFIQAQVNITNWYLNYLDCRLKKLSFASYEAFSRSSGFSSESGVLNAISILDLAPGEVIKEGKIVKSTCYSVVSGEITSKSGCLMYRSGFVEKNLTSNGEIVLGNFCTPKLRINFTHAMTANTDGTIFISPDTFINLYEEEGILEYPPKVVDNTALLMDIIKNSSLLNRIDGSVVVNVTTSKATVKIGLLDGFLDSTFSKLMMATIIAIYVVALILGVYYAVRWLVSRRQHTQTLVQFADQEVPELTRNRQPSELELKF